MASIGAEAIDVNYLLTSTRHAQAIYLQQILSEKPAQVSEITSQILAHVAHDSLPPHVFSCWLSVCKDPDSVIAALLQPYNQIAQHHAIKHIKRHMRHEKTFAEIWKAGSGATGFAAIASNLSVRNARALLKALGMTYTTPGARQERERGLSELLRTLETSLRADTVDGETGATDLRPLRTAYARLALACDAETILEWAKRIGIPLAWHRVVSQHADFFEQWSLGFTEEEHFDLFLDISQALVKIRPDFGLQMIDKFVEDQSLFNRRGYDIFDNIILPSVGRCSSKGASPDRYSRAWRLILQLRESRPNLRLSRPLLIRRCAHDWSHLPADQSMDECFRALLASATRDTIQSLELDALMRCITPTRQYETLRFIFLHAPNYGFDIGDCAGNMAGTCPLVPPPQFTLPVELFSALSPSNAFLLFERFYSANRAFVTRGDTYSMTTLAQAYSNDCEMVRALVAKRAEKNGMLRGIAQAVLEDLRRNVLSVRRKRAAEALEAFHRGDQASGALALSIALGDVSVYSQTLRWARRFLKDYLSLDLTLSSEALLSKESIRLLAAVPMEPNGSVIETIKECIRIGNDTILHLVESATMTVLEPSFSPAIWKRVFTLIHEVVKQRLVAVDAFQAHHGLSDDEIFGWVWEPTIQVLVRVESTLIQPRFEKLEYTWEDGLSPLGDGKRPWSCREPSLRFLDKLAQARDRLWEEHRVSLNYRVATLENPWSRGLPVHSLLSYATSISGYMPYIHSRAESVVFLPAAQALNSPPSDGETTKAIGKYVERWTEALKIYLFQPDNAEGNRRSRISRAWKHATTVLREEGMSVEEAVWFWMGQFQKAGVKEAELDSGEINGVLPGIISFPAVTDATQPTSWCPAPHVWDLMGSLREAKPIVTCLDVMLFAHELYGPESLSEIVSNLSQGKIPDPALWHHFRFSSWSTIESMDAVAAAAILLLNERCGLDTSILAKPFRGANNVRFPAVRLDPEVFKGERGPENAKILKVLEGIKGCIPPQLLAQLASSLLEKLKSAEGAEKPFLEFSRTIKLLSRGGRPCLAIPYIERFVLQHPDASSWHRIALNPGWLQNLPSAAARGFLGEFCDSLIRILDRQGESQVVEAAQEEVEDAETRVVEAGAEETAVQPSLKITTVKMVARLFHGSAAIDLSSAVASLSRILTKSTHINARSAAVEALVKTASNADEPTIRWRILEVIRAHAAPIASSINERRPLTDWRRAESEHRAPEIWADWDGHPPIGKCLLTFRPRSLGLRRGTKRSGIEKWQAEEFEAWDRLRYEILETWAENHRRWMKIFLDENGVQLEDGEEIPLIPAHPWRLREALERQDRVPVKLFEGMKQHLLLVLNPPRWVSLMNKAVKEDVELFSSNAGQQWLLVWDQEAWWALEHLGGIWAAEHMMYETEDLSGTGPTQEMVQALVLEIVDTLIEKEDLDTFDSLVKSMASGPCLRPIVDRIDRLRTAEWQSNPDRRPKYLPDTYPLRLKMLVALPGRGWEMSWALNLQDCVDGILALLEELAGSHFPYYTKLKMIKNHVSRVRARERPSAAVKLGRLSRDEEDGFPTLLDYLRVELAAYLLSERSDREREWEWGGEDELKQVKEMVESWERSRVEEFRVEARKVIRGEWKDLWTARP